MVHLFYPLDGFSHRSSENKPPEMTIERAVNLLTQDDEEMLICATSYIQNKCFHSEDAKKMVQKRFKIDSKYNLLAV